MRKCFAGLVVVLASCATAPLITQTNIPPTRYPVVPTPSSTAPPPTPSPPTPPYPLALSFTDGALKYPRLVADVHQAAATWNTAVKQTVFTFTPPGVPVTVGLMERLPSSGGYVVGQVDSLTKPTWVRFYPGLEGDPVAPHAALHELGHLLGCGHTANPADVMFAFGTDNVTLTPADIGQAQIHIIIRIEQHQQESR